MKRVGYYLHEVAACLLPKGTGCIKPALTNPLCVHGCCMEVPVLRGNVRAYLRARVTLLKYFDQLYFLLKVKRW